jgi:hypothetical protein
LRVFEIQPWHRSGSARKLTGTWSGATATADDELARVADARAGALRFGTASVTDGAAHIRACCKCCPIFAQARRLAEPV